MLKKKKRIIVILKNEKYSKIELFGKNQNNSKFWFSKIELICFFFEILRINGNFGH